MMNLWTLEPLIILLLTCVMGVLGILIFGSRRRVGQLKRSSAEIHQEERRVFDFLHGLGAAFSEGVPSGELHRLIVEGAAHTLKADGGALYLTDRTGKNFIPSFLSKGCPPFLIVPEHLRLEAAGGEKTQALESFLRLQAVPLGSSLLGEASEWKDPRLLSATTQKRGEESEEALPLAFVAQGLESIMLAPLIYRQKLLGVLALGRRVGSSPFPESKKELFQAIVEQSAFALFNQAIYLEAGEKHAMDHDLQIAREIQKILLPSDAPDLPGFELSGLNLPARTLSGDYFDYLPVDDDHLGVVIADVSGKGVPASLIMAMCRSAVRSQSRGHRSPSAVLSAVNRQLYPDMKEDMFISMAYVVINRLTGEALLARAGHDAPLFYQAETNHVERLNPKGMAVGIDSGVVFDRFCIDFSFRFQRGDLLLLYTDGLTEALDVGGNEFGIERLTEELLGNASAGAVETLHRLAHSVRAFSEGMPQHDDTTLIAIQKL
jgi:sigma-B regulation protein RsbU (phosphoserine phosphatase)